MPQTCDLRVGARHVTTSQALAAGERFIRAATAGRSAQARKQTSAGQAMPSRSQVDNFAPLVEVISRFAGNNFEDSLRITQRRWLL